MHRFGTTPLLFLAGVTLGFYLCLTNDQKRSHEQKATQIQTVVQGATSAERWTAESRPYAQIPETARRDEENLTGSAHADNAEEADRINELARIIEEITSGPTLATKLERAGGLEPSRSQMIASRVEELTVAALSEQAERDSFLTPLEKHSDLQRQVGNALRVEFGEEDFLHYRVATGQSTELMVGGVRPGSIAERAGIAPGDFIVAYNGRRVVDLADLNQAIAAHPFLTHASISVVRDGHPIHLYVPNQSLGISEVSPLSRLIGHEQGLVDPRLNTFAERPQL